MRAPKKAKLTVCAMGRNILPSIPVKAKIGMYTMRMIVTPKTADLPTRLVALLTVEYQQTGTDLVSFKFSIDLVQYPFHHDNRTIHDKAKVDGAQAHQVGADAKEVHHEKAKSMDKGMTEATIRLALKFPTSSSSTRITIIPPSIRFLLTVLMVRMISSERSR